MAELPILQAIRRVFQKKQDSRPQDLWNAQRLNAIKARYEAAQNLVEFDRFWSNADRFDADSAHSRDVRHTLISRSRYEVANNGYADGIAATYATDLVGVGPTLRMQTGNAAFNQMVEREWFLWSQAVQLRRKLWCMAHAKHVDGEAFAVVRRNPGVPHTVKLDVVLYEAEQIQTPMLPFDKAGAIDGMQFDRFGNPVAYHVLREHPGTNQSVSLDFVPERVPAASMLHWFRMRRPGQHRAVPECASTLNLGAAARRFREANVTTAEKVATWTLFLKTQFPPETFDDVDPMTSFELMRGMMTALPNTVEPFQLKAEHPASTYEMFHKILINEQARPKSMPFNKAACDSSEYNYASGRLDHQTYYSSLDVERADCDDLCMDRLFTSWLDDAILRFGWLGGDPLAVGPGARFHLWDWPKHRVADVEAEANANQTRLLSGQVGLHRLYSDCGLDLDDEIAEMAMAFGVDEAEVRKRLFDVVLPPVQQAAAPSPGPRDESQEPEEEEGEDGEQMAATFVNRVNGHVKHANGKK